VINIVTSFSKGIFLLNIEDLW